MAGASHVTCGDTWRVHMGVGYTDTAWVEIRRPHGTCGTLLWLLRSISVTFYKCGKIRPKYPLQKHDLGLKLAISWQHIDMIIRWANWYSWDHDVLHHHNVFTPIVQRSLPTPDSHQSQMMTHLRHRGHYCTLYPDLGITAIIKPYSGHPSTLCLHSIISQPPSPVQYK